MRGQVTLEALVVMLALAAAIGLWVATASQAVSEIRGELGNSTIHQAEQRIDALCATAEAMGKGNIVTARVYVARDCIVSNVFLRAGWNNVTAEWDGYCRLASTTSEQYSPS